MSPVWLCRSDDRDSERQERQRAGGSMPALILLGSAVLAGAVYYRRQLLLAIDGWAKDRQEDCHAVELSPAMRQRMHRMRKWRRLLSEERRQMWAAEGAAGPGLRDYQKGQYSRELEEQLVAFQPGGAVVNQREVIFLRRADGGWAMAEAMLNTVNEMGLLIPAALASQLGYANQEGQPFPEFAPPEMEQVVEVGREDSLQINPVTCSIAGQEFSEQTFIVPRGVLLEVPVQIVRGLRQRGILFSYV